MDAVAIVIREVGEDLKTDGCQDGKDGYCPIEETIVSGKAVSEDHGRECERERAQSGSLNPGFEGQDQEYISGWLRYGKIGNGNSGLRFYSLEVVYPYPKYEGTMLILVAQSG